MTGVDVNALITRNQDGQLSAVQPASLPEIPQDVQQVLQSGIASSRLVFPDDAPARRLETWKTPVVSDRRLLRSLETCLAAIEASLEPVERGYLVFRVMALLSHYRQEVLTPEMDLCVADDWAEDLGDYPIWAIDEAARRWRRTRKFKPQICEIVALCDDACACLATTRDRLRAIVAASRAAPDMAAARTLAVVRAVSAKLRDGK